MLSKEKIAKIEEALRLRHEYTGVHSMGQPYLDKMDALAINEPGETLNEKLVSLIDKYLVYNKITARLNENIKTC